MKSYVDEALEIIKENYLYYLSKEYKTFIFNIKLYELNNNMFELFFSNHKQDVFIELGEEGEKVTFNDFHNLINDPTQAESLYNLTAENTYKNFISIVEDYLKEILEYLFNKYPEHVFLKNEKVSANLLIKYDNLEDLQEKFIQDKVISLSYGNLTDMVKYIEKEFKVSFGFDQEIMDALLEMTLIRNILVHNKGIINEKFLEKMEGKSASFTEDTYTLNSKINMYATEIGEVFEMLTIFGEKLSEVLKGKFNTDE